MVPEQKLSMLLVSLFESRLKPYTEKTLDIWFGLLKAVDWELLEPALKAEIYEGQEWPSIPALMKRVEGLEEARKEPLRDSASKVLGMALYDRKKLEGLQDWEKGVLKACGLWMHDGLWDSMQQKDRMEAKFIDDYVNAADKRKRLS